mgnify:CR=1 FL=1
MLNFGIKTNLEKQWDLYVIFRRMFYFLQDKGTVEYSNIFNFGEFGLYKIVVFLQTFGMDF